jgi:hypothetical protein
MNSQCRERTLQRTKARSTDLHASYPRSRTQARSLRAGLTGSCLLSATVPNLILSAFLHPRFLRSRKTCFLNNRSWYARYVAETLETKFSRNYEVQLLAKGGVLSKRVQGSVAPRSYCWRANAAIWIVSPFFAC